jgi:hypothetical protein
MAQMSLLQPPLTLAQLESYLWEAANILRGSPVDRTDWKSIKCINDRSWYEINLNLWIAAFLVTTDHTESDSDNRS